MKLLVDLAVPAITILVLFAIGLDLAPADFSRVRRRPGIVVLGLGAPLVLLPPIALALAALFEPPAAMLTGLLLITACPIGGISNTYSYLADASTALSVTLTALSSLLAVVTIPLLDRAFGLVLGQPLGLTAPEASMLARLLLMLALPVSFGVLVRGRWPQFAERSRPHLKRVGFGALAASWWSSSRAILVCSSLAFEARCHSPRCSSSPGSRLAGWSAPQLEHRPRIDSRWPRNSPLGTSPWRRPSRSRWPDAWSSHSLQPRISSPSCP